MRSHAVVLGIVFTTSVSVAAAQDAGVVDAHALCADGWTQLRAGDAAGAEATLERGVAAISDSDTATRGACLYSLARSEEAQGKRDEALAHYDASLDARFDLTVLERSASLDPAGASHTYDEPVPLPRALTASIAGARAAQVVGCAAGRGIEAIAVRFTRAGTRGRPMALLVRRAAEPWTALPLDAWIHEGRVDEDIGQSVDVAVLAPGRGETEPTVFVTHHWGGEGLGFDPDDGGGTYACETRETYLAWHPSTAWASTVLGVRAIYDRQTRAEHLSSAPDAIVVPTTDGRLDVRETEGPSSARIEALRGVHTREEWLDAVAP